MTKSNDTQVNNLKVMAQFVLFVTSYLPLFILVIVRQIYENHNFINFGGFNLEAIMLFFQKFGLSAILLSISLFGLLGCSLIFKNLEKDATNGDNVTVLNVIREKRKAIKGKQTKQPYNYKKQGLTKNATNKNCKTKRLHCFTSALHSSAF